MPKIGAWLVKQFKTLDLLLTYLQAVYKAWGDYLFEALLVSPIIIWWFVASPPGIPSPPVYLVIAAFAWAFLVVTYYTWRKERIRLIPQIELQEIRQQKAPGKGGETRTYVQLVLRCATEAPLEDCKGRLVDVWEWSGNTWKQIEPNQPL